MTERKPLDPRAAMQTERMNAVREIVKQHSVAATSYDVARITSLLMKRCTGAGDGFHEIDDRPDDHDEGVRAACVLCGLIIPPNISDEQLEAARQIVLTKRCPGCGCGMLGKRSGQLKTIQGVFQKTTFDCGSELSLTGFNRDGTGCVRPSI